MKKTTLIQRLAKRVSIAGLALASLVTTTQAQLISPAVTNIWRFVAGTEYDFLAAADGLVRGVSLNPVTGNVIYATRAGGSNHLAVIDGVTGLVTTRLSGVGVTGGTLALTQVKVADDGVIYAANLAAATSTLKIYRWDSDSTTLDPTNVFSFAGVSTRYGDTMDLRGSGTNTQIIISGSGATKFALLTTKDGWNFNAETNELGVLTNYMTEINLPAGLAAGDIGKALAFDGTNNAFFGKRDATSPNNIRYVTFNPTLLTSVLVTNASADGRLIGFDLATTNGFKVVGGVLYGSGTTLLADQHRARFYDVTTTNTAQLIFDDPLTQPTPTYFANGNAVSAADGQNGRIVVLEPNNGIALYQLYLVTNPPPSITSQPVGSTNVLTGGFYTLSVSSSGSSLRYQWFLGAGSLSGKTNASLNLTNITIADAGNYTVVVTNVGGAVTSSVATIGLQPSVLTTEAAKLWQVLAGSRSYITTDNNQRGMAFHALSNQVLVVNRAGTLSINQVDASTGANVTNLNMTGVGPQVGEQFQISAAGVADDGAIYVCNLANITSGGFFTIYRWADANPATVATVAYGPDNPGVGRIGDVLAVQGSGVNTKILASSRSGTAVVVFTTSDGVTFTPNIVDVALAPTPAPAGFAGLGLAAGAGDSFWATAGGFQLRKVVYDLVNATNDVVASLGGQTGSNIGVDEVNSFVASVGSGDTPANLRILDISDPTSPAAVLVDQEFFCSDNDNSNGTGAVAFDVAGGRVFALDSNNGLIALKYAPRLKANGNVLTWTGPGVLQSATTVTGPYNDIVGSTSPLTTNTTGNVFFKVRR